MSSHEHAEHAEHAAHAGNKRIALLIAVLAALLALCETGGKAAQTAAEQASIHANDLWSFFQAKTIRMTVLRGNADLADTIDLPADKEAAARRTKLVEKWRADAQRYDSDPAGGEGRKELAEKAKEAEHTRDENMIKLHGFEYASAALQLAIVIATAAVITGVGWVLALSIGLGAVGAGLGGITWLAPHLLHVLGGH